MLTQEELFTKIDASLAAMVGGQAEAQSRIAELEKSKTAFEARILASDETIKTQADRLFEIEKKANTFRFGITGVDSLAEALPQDLKPWIARVKALRGGVATVTGGSRLNGAAKMADMDPVLYVGIGGYFQARVKAVCSMKNGRPDKAQEWSERAEKIAEALGGIDAETKASLQEDTAIEGGYIIPTIVESAFLSLLKEASVVRASGPTMVQMTTKTHQLPSLANDFTVSWVAEEGTIGDAAPATPFAQGNLTAKKQAGLVTISMELVQDNIINLMDFVMSHLIQQMGRAEDLEALEGTGATFTGINAASGVNSVAMSGAITMTGLAKLKFGAEHMTTIDGSSVFMHPWVLREILLLNTGTGGVPWFNLIAAGNITPNNVLGSLFPTSVISRAGAVSNAYNGQMKALVIGDRMGTTFDIDPYGLFASAQIRLRLLRRVGILVWVPAYFTKLTAITTS